MAQSSKQRLNIPFGFGVYTYDIQWDQQWGERGGDVCFAAAQREGEREIDEMKRRKNSSRPLCLGDLILAVSRYSDSKEETAATVADLLASGRVKIMTNGRKVRARVLAHSY